MKKTLTVLLVMLLVMLLAVRLSGCSRYSSSYHAVGFVHSNESASACMDFFSFDGTMVFKLKCDAEAEGRLAYTGRLEEGRLQVYYDNGDGKTELFSLDPGGEVRAELPLEQGRVYIIVETDGECRNGGLEFEIN